MRDTTRVLIAEDRMNSLTLQERAILGRVAQRECSKEIARALCISVRTVDAHRANICRKLGIHGNYRLLRYATQGYVPPLPAP